MQLISVIFLATGNIQNSSYGAVGQYDSNSFD